MRINVKCSNADNTTELFEQFQPIKSSVSWISINITTMDDIAALATILDGSLHIECDPFNDSGLFIDLEKFI